MSHGSSDRKEQQCSEGGSLMDEKSRFMPSFVHAWHAVLLLIAMSTTDKTATYALDAISGVMYDFILGPTPRDLPGIRDGPFRLLEALTNNRTVSLPEVRIK